MSNFLNNMPIMADEQEDEKLWDILIEGMSKQDSYLKKNIYASTAHCPRYNAMTLNTVIQNDSEPSLALYAQLGDCIESFVADSLKNSKRLIDMQYKPKLDDDDPPISLSGKIDILYINHKRQLAILEVKSTGLIDDKENPYYKKDGTVGNSKKAGVSSSGPSVGHKKQAEIYAAITGIQDVSILYLARNVIEKFGDGIAHYIYKVDTGYDNMLSVMTDLYYAQLCNTQKVVPNRPKGYRKSIECKFCDFLEQCYNVYPSGDNTKVHKDLLVDAATLAEVFMSNIYKRRNAILLDLTQSGKLRLK